MKEGVVTLPDQNRPLNFAWFILTLLYFSQFVMALGAYIWGPVGPYLINSLGVSLTQIGSFNSIFYLVATLVATPIGILVDKLSTKLILVSALAIMGFSFFAMGMSGSYIAILFFSALAGLGYGTINQISVKDLGIWFPKNLRAFVFGIRQTGVTIGAAIGAVIITIVADIGGWQLSIWFASSLLFLMAFLCFFFYKSGEAPTTNVNAKKESLFKVPINDVLKILKQPILIICTSVGFLLSGSQVVISTFLILYLKTENVFPDNDFLGIFLTIVMIAATIGRIGWGIISDRLLKSDRLKSLAIISFIATFSSICLLLTKTGTPEWTMYITSFLLGLSFAGFQGVWFACISDAVPIEYTGVITGIMITISWIGIVIFPVLFGIIVDQTNYFWGWMAVVVAGTLSLVPSLVFSLSKKKAINENI